LVITVYRKINSELTHTFHSFFNENTQTWDFVVKSWQILLTVFDFNTFQKVTLISDGGPKHFKINVTTSYWIYLSQQFKLRFHYIFYCAYHGSNICDSHAVMLKRPLKASQRHGIIESIEEAYQIIKDKNLKNTSLYMLDEYSHNLPDFKHYTIENITSCHDFVFHIDELKCSSYSYQNEECSGKSVLYEVTKEKLILKKSKKRKRREIEKDEELEDEVDQ
jgi:hypothetical protein